MRALVSDTRISIRNALQVLLTQADISVIGMAATPKELIEKSLTLQPDLILIDWELGGDSTGKSLVRLLHGLDHYPLIVTLSIDSEARAIAMAAGSDAFISKGDAPEQVWIILEAVISQHRKTQLT